MPFTGKATYTAGAALPELAEDVADIIGIISPFETPLLDHLGEARRPARSTVHEWIEDSLLPNSDQINQTTFTPGPTTATSITVDNGSRFRVGDQVRPEGAEEIMLVTAVATNTLTVTRGYGGTTPFSLTDNLTLNILGNAAIEGDRSAARKTRICVTKREFHPAQTIARPSGQTPNTGFPPPPQTNPQRPFNRPLRAGDPSLA